MTDLRDLVRRQFGLNAERYVSSYDHSRGESLDRMVELVDPKPDWRALDIATGGGHTALAFAPRVREVVATEIFRKARDFEAWAGLQTVSDSVKAELRRRLELAPPGPAKALGPETRDGTLYFYLTEILIVARRTA